MDTQLELYSARLKKSSDLYDVVAEMHGVDPGLVKKIVESQFAYVAEHIRGRKTDTILLNKFATIQMKPAKVDSIIRGLIKKYRRGELPREKLKAELEILFPIRRALKQNKTKRNDA